MGKVDMGKLGVLDRMREWVAGLAHDVFLWAYRLTEVEYTHKILQEAGLSARSENQLKITTMMDALIEEINGRNALREFVWHNEVRWRRVNILCRVCDTHVVDRSYEGILQFDETLRESFFRDYGAILEAHVCFRPVDELEQAATSDPRPRSTLRVIRG